MIDDDMPKSVGLMYTPISERYYLTTGSWTPTRLHGTSYESMIHFKDRDTNQWKGRMIYHKSLRSAFHAHLSIVKELKKLSEKQ